MSTFGVVRLIIALIASIRILATICVILANLIVDIAYAYIDPRIRLSR